MSTCQLCFGSGQNRSGLVMPANNHICPRCGGYGSVPDTSPNPEGLTGQDREYARRNGWIEPQQGEAA